MAAGHKGTHEGCPYESRNGTRIQAWFLEIYRLAKVRAADLKNGRYGLTGYGLAIDRVRTSLNSSGMSARGFPFMLLALAASAMSAGTSCSLTP